MSELNTPASGGDVNMVTEVIATYIMNARKSGISERDISNGVENYKNMLQSKGITDYETIDKVNDVAFIAREATSEFYWGDAPSMVETKSRK